MFLVYEKRLRKSCLLFMVFFLISFISAEAISNQLHVNIQVTDGEGKPQPGYYKFTFNITNDVTCTNVIYSNITYLTTDSRGIISYYLENVDLNFTDQYWLCYYRNDSLINSSKMGLVPYAFMAKNVTSGGIIFDSNLDAGTYNVSGSWIKGIFNWLIGATSSNYLAFNGTQLDFSESALNTTIDSRITSSGSITWGVVMNGTLATWEQAMNGTLAKTTDLVDFNASGLIKNWNATGYIKDWNASGFLINWSLQQAAESDPYWTGNMSSYYNKTEVTANITSANTSMKAYVDLLNTTGLIRNWNVSGFIVNWSLESAIESDPYWADNFTKYNLTWTSTYNETYHGYNATGLIRDWNVTGLIINWSGETGSGGEPLWNANFTNVAFTNTNEVFDFDVNISGNLTLGTGEIYSEIYYNGTTNLFDTLGNNIIFTDNLTADNIIAVGDVYANGVKLGSDTWTGNMSSYYNKTEVTTNISFANTSMGYYVNSTFLRKDGDNGTGTYHFNQGWTEGGMTLSGGDLYAQTIYVYNITSLSVNNLAINGSLLPQLGFSNTFDVGNSTLTWRHGTFGGNVTASWFLGNINYSNVQNAPDWNASSLIINWSLESAVESDPYWGANYSTFLTHITWANVVNGTMATWAQAMNGTLAKSTDLVNYNSSGLIRDWNATGYIKNWQVPITSANTSMKAYVDSRDTTFNNSMKAYVDAQGFLTSYTETDPKWGANYSDYLTTKTHATRWSANYSTFLTHITWAQVMNNTLLQTSQAYNATWARTNRLNSFGAYNQSFDTNVLFIDAVSDRVGIGTTIPTQPLDVKGNINISATSSNPYLYFGKGGYMYDNGTTTIIGHV